MYAQPSLLRASLVVACKEAIACVVCSASRRLMTHTCVRTHTHTRLRACNICFCNWLEEQRFTGWMCVCAAAMKRNTSVVPFQLFVLF